MIFERMLSVQAARGRGGIIVSRILVPLGPGYAHPRQAPCQIGGREPHLTAVRERTQFAHPCQFVGYTWPAEALKTPSTTRIKFAVSQPRGAHPSCLAHTFPGLRLRVARPAIISSSNQEA